MSGRLRRGRRAGFLQDAWCARSSTGPWSYSLPNDFGRGSSSSPAVNTEADVQCRRDSPGYLRSRPSRRKQPFGNDVRNLLGGSEDAVPTRTDQAAHDDQHNAEDDLALDELNDADDDQDRGDDPQDGCTHLGFLFLPNGTWQCPIAGRPNPPRLGLSSVAWERSDTHRHWRCVVATRAWHRATEVSVADRPHAHD